MPCRPDQRPGIDSDQQWCIADQLESLIAATRSSCRTRSRTASHDRRGMPGHRIRYGIDVLARLLPNPERSPLARTRPGGQTRAVVAKDLVASTRTRN